MRLNPTMLSINEQALWLAKKLRIDLTTHIFIFVDSGSNVHLIPKSLVYLFGIQEFVNDIPGTLNGIGSSPTLGSVPIVIPIPTVNNDIHIFTHRNALIIDDNTGPQSILLSEVEMELLGYKWCSSRDEKILITPDGQEILLTRHPISKFWYIVALKNHELAEAEKDKTTMMTPSKRCRYISLTMTETKPHAKMRIPKTQFNILPQSITEIIENIHNATGHVGIARLRELAQKELVDGLEILLKLPDPTNKLQPCEGCALGNMMKNPAPKYKTEKLQHPPHGWGGMSIDMTGPFDPSVEKNEYALLFVHTDDKDENGKRLRNGGTGFTIIKLIKRKSDALFAIRDVINTVGTPGRIHSDNAKEFTSEMAQEYFTSIGCEITTSPPYTPYANGKVENTIGKIKKIARANILASGVSVTAWSFAIQYAAIQHNMTSFCPDKTKTKYEAYYNKRPDLRMLIPFGCLTHVLLTKEQQKAQGIDKAWGPRSLAGLYMGMLTLSGMVKHIILTTDQQGWLHVATTLNNIRPNPRYFPGRPQLTIPITQIQNAIATTCESELDDELSPESFVSCIKIALKDRKALPITRPKTTSEIKSTLIHTTTPPTPTSPRPKPKLKKGWYEAEKILEHKGPPHKREYLVRWKGYSKEHDSWQTEVSKSLLEAYKKSLEEKKHANAQTTKTKVRIIPQDILNGDNKNVDPFQVSKNTKTAEPLRDPRKIKIQGLPPDWIEIAPYDESTYTQLIPYADYKPPTKSHPLVNREIRTHHTSDPTQDECVNETGKIKSFHQATDTFQVEYSDGTSSDLHADVVENNLVRYTGITKYEEEFTYMKFEEYYAYLLASDKTEINPEPKGMKKILNHPESKAILEAMKKELDSFEEMKVYEEIPSKDVPKHIEKLRAHFVVTRKYKRCPTTNKDVFDRWKVRLVFNGKHQKELGETFSPTPLMSTIRIILAVCCTKEWTVLCWDLGNAFCAIQVEGRAIYVIPPDGCPGVKPGHIWRILKWVYGLQESNREFYNAFMKQILSFPLKEGHTIERSSTETCLFIIRNQDKKAIFYAIFYVDDLITADTSKNKQLTDAFITHIRKVWKVTAEGELTRYLGVAYTRMPDGGWELNAHNYIHKSFTKEEFNLYPIPLNPTTPLPSNFKINTEDWDDYKEDPEFTRHYRKALGKAGFAGTICRFDIAFTHSLLSQYLSKPTTKLMMAAYRLIGYLLGSSTLSIRYRDPSSKHLRNRLYGAVDASYGEDLFTKRSQSGILGILNGGPILWCSRRQDTVALSTAEAEFMAAVEAAKRLIHASNILNDLGHIQGPITLFEDNTAVIALTEGNASPGNGRMKHFDIKLHWLIEIVKRKVIRLSYCQTNRQVADMLTKSLPLPAFRACIQYALDPENNLPPLVQD